MLRQARSALRRSLLGHRHGRATGAGMDDSASWKSEETIVRLATVTCILEIWWLSPSPRRLAEGYAATPPLVRSGDPEEAAGWDRRPDIRRGAGEGSGDLSGDPRPVGRQEPLKLSDPTAAHREFPMPYSCKKSRMLWGDDPRSRHQRSRVSTCAEAGGNRFRCSAWPHSTRSDRSGLTSTRPHQTSGHAGS